MLLCACSQLCDCALCIGLCDLCISLIPETIRASPLAKETKRRCIKKCGCVIMDAMQLLGTSSTLIS